MIINNESAYPAVQSAEQCQYNRMRNYNVNSVLLLLPLVIATLVTFFGPLLFGLVRVFPCQRLLGIHSPAKCGT